MSSDRDNTEAPETRPETLEDVLKRVYAPVAWGALPGQLLGAFRLVRTDGGSILVRSICWQMVAGVGGAIQVLLGARLVGDALRLNASRAATGILVDVLTLAVASAFAGVAAAYGSQLSRLLSEVITRTSERRIMDRTTAAELGDFESPEFHDQVERARRGSLSADELTRGVMSFTTSAITVVGAGVALVLVQPLLVLVVLVAFTPMLLHEVLNAQSEHSLITRYISRNREKEYLFRLLTSRASAKEVRAFSLARFIRQRYEDLYADYLAALGQYVRGRTRRALLSSVFSSALLAGSAGGLIALLAARAISPSSAGAALVAVFLVGPRVDSLVRSIGIINRTAVFVDDYLQFVSLTPASTATEEPSPPPRTLSTLRAEGVSYTYPGDSKAALTAVDIEIGAAQMVALVGENGSGKTTLAKILCGLYAPTAGRVLWDDVDLKVIDTSDLRSSIAVIFQDFVRYEMSVRRNIGMGNHTKISDLDAIKQVARDVGADSFIAGLPNGYETQLGREFLGGTELSVGQWQRVALGRALLRDAPLLVLDEPTASLDARAEHDLFENIKVICRDRAVLLISHRFSTVRAANMIYVLKGGRIVEKGSHDELVAARGHYAELYALQAAAYAP